jgi:hypothetical protein
LVYSKALNLSLIEGRSDSGGCARLSNDRLTGGVG